MVSQFQGLFDMAERDRVTIRHMLDGMNAGIARQGMLDGPQLHEQLDRMVALQSEMVAYSVDAPVVSGSMIAQPAERRGWLSGLFGTSPAALVRRERKKLRAEVRDVALTQKKFARTIEGALDRSIGTIEAGRRSDHAMLADMIAQNERNQARLTQMLDRLGALEEGASGDHDLTAELHGARQEMDMLRRRMNISQEQASASPPVADAETNRKAS